LLAISSFGTTFMTVLHYRIIRNGLSTLHLLRPVRDASLQGLVVSRISLVTLSTLSSLLKDVKASRQVCGSTPPHPIAFEVETTSWQRLQVVLGSNPLLVEHACLFPYITAS